MVTSALLRLAGCPIRLWLVGANPDLFSRVRQLDELQDEYSSLGRRIAEDIGLHVVPHQSLSRKDRALALNIRRQFYNGSAISAASCGELRQTVLNVVPEAGQLINDLALAPQISRTLVNISAELSAVLMDEEITLSRAAVELAFSTPVMQALLAYRSPRLFEETHRRLRGGTALRGKRLRRTADFVWRTIDRAATKSTPRDWHSHIALIMVTSDGSTRLSIALNEEVVTVWSENIHSQRQALCKGSLECSEPMRIALTPLHWATDDQLQFWVVDPDNPMHISEVEMRRTPLLDSIYRALVPGVITLREFEASLVSEPDEEQADLLRNFTKHLVRVGVLQVSSPTQVQTEEWRSIETIAGKSADAGSSSDGCKPRASARLKRDGFLDVYRRTCASLPLPFCLRLQGYMELAQRVLGLIEADRRNAGGPSQYMDEQPRPLLVLLKERSQAEPVNGGPKRPPHWPPASDKDSPYARLLRFILARADQSTIVDISRELLDELGAPAGSIDWPIDCTLRVPRSEAGYEAILEEAFPAGSLDARFVTTLRNIHDSVPHADSYHEFLEVLEQTSGTIFLELLIPPLSVGAANAVSRPIYTRAWTGDPDIYTYSTLRASMPRYIPLSAISIGRVGGRVLAEAEGHPVCPVYHATRIPLAPWSTVADILLSAGPLPMRWSPRRLHFSLDAFPDRQFMPRITVGHGLVLACAQWRLSSGTIWSSGSDTLAKIRALDRLRRQWRLPRWVFVSAGHRRKPISCDLESIRAIPLFEKAANSDDANILVTEMLPTPDDLLVVDEASGGNDRVASAVMLRLPCDETPSSMASRLRSTFSQATSGLPYGVPRRAVTMSMP
jgi:Lantibiotic dehydratase, N terminus